MAGCLTRRLGFTNDGGGPSSGGVVNWNTLDKDADIILSGSNLIALKNTGTGLKSVRGNFGRNAATDGGYFEVLNTDNGGAFPDQSPFRLYGISSLSMPTTAFCGSDVNSYGYYEDTGDKYFNNAGTAYGPSYRTADTVGIALKNGKLWFSKNGVWQGNPAAGTGEAFSGITGIVYPTASLYRSGTNAHRAIFRGAVYNCVYPAPAGIGYWER